MPEFAISTSKFCTALRLITLRNIHFTQIAIANTLYCPKTTGGRLGLISLSSSYLFCYFGIKLYSCGEPNDATD